MSETYRPEANPEIRPESEQILILLEKQFAWMSAEMDYSWTKDGYATKLDRFKRHPDEPGSVLANMSSYWDRFENDDRALRQAGLDEQARLHLAARSLVFLGKTTAGMADKAAMALWLNRGRPGNYTADALTRIKSHVISHRAVNPHLFYYGLMGEGTDFKWTDMGVRILAMHNAVRDGADDPDAYRSFLGSWSETLLGSAVGAAAASLCAWQTQARRLGAMGLKPKMPKPGVSGGAIEPWDSPAADIWS